MRRIPLRKVPWRKVGSVALSLGISVGGKALYDYFEIGELLGGESTGSGDAGGSAESLTGNESAGNDATGNNHASY